MTDLYQDKRFFVSGHGFSHIASAPQSMRLQPPSFADRVFVSTLSGALMVGLANAFGGVLQEDFSCRWIQF